MTDTPQKPQDDPADFLANMADGVHEEPDQASDYDQSAQSNKPDTDHPAPAPDDDPFDGVPAPSRSAARRRPAGPRKPAQPTRFHHISAQLSVSMGILLLIPVVVSALVLAGVLEMGDSNTMPIVLLVLCLPLSLIMLFGGLWYGKYLKRMMPQEELEEEEPEEEEDDLDVQEGEKVDVD